MFSALDDVIGTPTVPLTLTTTYYSAIQNTGTGTPDRGVWFSLLFSAVAGNPNVLAKIQTSPDGTTWFDNAFDELGPVNSVTQRSIHFSTQYQYWRAALLFDTTDPGESSSSSSGSIGQSITVFGGLTVTRNG